MLLYIFELKISLTLSLCAWKLGMFLYEDGLLLVLVLFVYDNACLFLFTFILLNVLLFFDC